ncbi:uncharacterized protein C8R40DRAFT_1071826 [Lentinula edodes]|uniref:uncharacterized protein n=1 Tax=Lentinula edodes TaxID=5353 RepID=UPI001E8E0348|nr:uncharacterized protein C8R40DRAFT_1071826 [Lentinula edodes]KAH7872336.1 hypothetical protein C8R40DRAFT_1071826 [Lentinula edodes]
MTHAEYVQHHTGIKKLKPADFAQAAEDERRKRPYSNPVMRALSWAQTKAESVYLLESESTLTTFNLNRDPVAHKVKVVEACYAPGIFLDGALLTTAMKDCLWSEAFHKKVSEFVAKNITADIGLNSQDLMQLHTTPSLSFNCPLLPNNPEYMMKTKDMTFYFMVYASKKQHKSSNESMILVKRKNSLPPNLMGWGDRYISHFSVPIYLDGISAALQQTFEALQSKRVTANDSSVGAVEATWDSTANEDSVRLTTQNGKITVKNQLQVFEQIT